MGDNGWISTYRSIRENWVWEDKPFAKGQAWMDLLLRANHEDVVKMVKGRPHKFEKGTVSISQRKLAEAWGWSRTKVIHFLHDLETTGMIEKKTTDYTTIRLVNWDKFQEVKTKKKTTHNTTEQTTDNTTGDTLNNNDLTMSNNIKRVNFVPPSLEEVAAYCSDRKNGIDPESFIAFYQSKGWMIGKNKMKDWKAAVRTWEQRETKTKKKEDEIDAKQRAEYGNHWTDHFLDN